MKIGQINTSYIGTTYQTPKGGTLTVIGYSDKRRGKNIIWHVECSICSNDKELFPEPFNGNKFQMDSGQCPCACSPYRYSENQNVIRLKRKGLIVKMVVGNKFYVEDISNAVCYSGTINQLLNGYRFKPMIPVKHRATITREDPNKKSNDRARREFFTMANVNGFTVVGDYKTAHVSVDVVCKNGHLTSPQPATLKHRGWTCRTCIKAGGYRAGSLGYLYLLVSTDKNIYKVGISNNANHRIRDLKRKTPFEFDVIGVFYHEDGSVVMSAESSILKSFESAGLSGFCGATEWIKADGSITDMPLKLGLKFETNS